MKLRQLEYVHYIVQHETIRKASEVLYVTQPTISQQVKNLEEQLGFKIFEKDGRKIRLTEHGNKIYPDIKELIECVCRLEQTIESIKNPENGLISFGIGPISSNHLIQSLYNSFREKHNNVSVNIMESGSMELLNLVERNKIDMAIINTSEDIRSYMNANGIAFKTLFKSEFVLMVPDNHRLINKEKISYKDITNEPIMLYRNGLIQSTMIQLLGKKYKENIILSFVDYISITNLVRDGVGVSIVPKSYLSTLNDDQRKGIVALELSDFENSMKVSLIYLKRAYYPEYLRYFIDLITHSHNKQSFT